MSAYCGVVSAGVVSVAGIAFLKGDSKDIIENTLVNGLASLSGIVCDGAKPSCAGKIAISLDGAFMGYKQARLNKNYQKGDGLVAYSVDETIRSIGAVAQGMKETDVVILNEMLNTKLYVMCLVEYKRTFRWFLYFQNCVQFFGVQFTRRVHFLFIVIF